MSQSQGGQRGLGARQSPRALPLKKKGGSRLWGSEEERWGVTSPEGSGDGGHTVPGVPPTPSPASAGGGFPRRRMSRAYLATTSSCSLRQRRCRGPPGAVPGGVPKVRAYSTRQGAWPPGPPGASSTNARTMAAAPAHRKRRRCLGRRGPRGGWGAGRPSIRETGRDWPKLWGSESLLVDKGRWAGKGRGARLRRRRCSS